MFLRLELNFFFCILFYLFIYLFVERQLQNYIFLKRVTSLAHLYSTCYLDKLKKKFAIADIYFYALSTQKYHFREYQRETYDLQNVKKKKEKKKEITLFSSLLGQEACMLRG